MQRMQSLLDSNKVGALMIGAVLAITITAALPVRPQSSNAIVIAPACISSRASTTETVSVPYQKITVEDPLMEAGKTRTQTTGMNSVKTKMYEITTNAPANCAEDQKRLIKEEITSAPVAEVTVIGTKAVAEPAPATCNTDESANCTADDGVNCREDSGRVICE